MGVLVALSCRTLVNTGLVGSNGLQRQPHVFATPVACKAPYYLRVPGICLAVFQGHKGEAVACKQTASPVCHRKPVNINTTTHINMNNIGAQGEPQTTTIVQYIATVLLALVGRSAGGACVGSKASV